MKNIRRVFYIILAVMFILPLGIYAEDDDIPEDLKNDGLTEYTIYNRTDNTKLYCNYNLAYIQTDQIYYDIRVSEADIQITEGGDDLICEYRSDNESSQLMVTSMGDDEEKFISAVKNEQSHNNRTHNYKSGGRFRIHYSPVTAERYIYYALNSHNDTGASTSAIVRIRVAPKSTTSEGSDSGNATQNTTTSNDDKAVNSTESTSKVDATKEKNPETADMNIVQIAVLSIIFVGIAMLSYKKVVKN